MTRLRFPGFAIILLSIAMFSATASSARAQDDEIKRDARLEGYTQKVEVGGSTALMWLLLALLAAIAVGVLFKDAKRSHLD